MTTNPYESPTNPETGKLPQRKSDFPNLAVRLLVLVGILLLLVAMLLPGYRGGAPREAARRMQCASNLRNIVVALHSYESTYGCLPPAYTIDADGKPLHSWRTLILPFIDQQLLYNQIDFSNRGMIRQIEPHRKRASSCMNALRVLRERATRP